MDRGIRSRLNNSRGKTLQFSLHTRCAISRRQTNISLSQSNNMPVMTTKIRVLGAVSDLLFRQIMPVIPIALDNQTLVNKGEINDIIPDDLLRSWEQSYFLHCLLHHDFNVAYAVLLRLYAQYTCTAFGASTKATYETWLNLTNLSADLARHFYFIFPEGMISTANRLRPVETCAFCRTMICFRLPRGSRKFLLAISTNLLYPLLTRILFYRIRALTAAIFTFGITSFVLKLFSAFSTSVDGIDNFTSGVACLGCTAWTAIYFLVAWPCCEGLPTLFTGAFFSVLLPDITAYKTAKAVGFARPSLKGFTANGADALLRLLLGLPVTGFTAIQTLGTLVGKKPSSTLSTGMGYRACGRMSLHGKLAFLCHASGYDSSAGATKFMS